MDQWGWRCSTRSCVGHTYELPDIQLCSTHASLCFAYGGEAPPFGAELQDLFDQTPTLLRWVTRGLHGGIAKLLDPEDPRSVSVRHEVVAGKTISWQAEWRSLSTDWNISVDISGSADPWISLFEGENLELKFQMPENLNSRTGEAFSDGGSEVDVRAAVLRRLSSAISLSGFTGTMINLAGAAKIELEFATAV